MADTQSTNWDDAVRAKRAALQDKIPQSWRLSPEILDTINETANFGVLQVPKTCGILTARELSLTEDYDATELVAMLREGKVKSEEVVAAFCKRSAIAQQLTNCLTEIMFDEAMQRAAELDRRIANGQGPIGPLHGLPISLKDSFNLKGVATTLGYVSFLDRPPATHNSTVVDILLDLGAVPFVKTNIPQCMMSADSENHVFGRTLNPNRLCLTAGGSTGGEGALMALGGSVLGVCTDVGGSARIPAHCNGIIGFKPTAGRIPFFGGGLPGRPGNPGGIGVSLGPQTRTLRDVELFMRCVIDSGPWKYDQTALNVPWRRPGGLQRKLKLGLILEDPQRPLHPPQFKMMTKLTEALKAHGHEVLSIVDKVPSLWSTSLLAGKYFMLDPQKTPMKVLEAGGEKPIKSLLVSSHAELRGWKASLDELWDMNVEKGKVIKAYHDVVVQHDLDAILLPPYQATAVPHDTWGMFIYTVLANMLEYPALVMPYLAASEEEDRAFLREDVVYDPPYTPKLVENAPCGFQLLGRPCGDEELLQVAEVIQQAISS